MRVVILPGQKYIFIGFFCGYARTSTLQFCLGIIIISAVSIERPSTSLLLRLTFLITP